MNKEMMDELQAGIEALPEEVRQQLFGPGEAPIDAISVKLDLIKFVTELQKHNQACDWETNKIKPKKIEIDDIISDSNKIFNFLIE